MRPVGHPGRARLFFFGKPVSHSPARPSLKKPGSVRPYPKPDGLAGWEYCPNLSSFSNMGIDLRPQFSKSQLAAIRMSRIVYKFVRLASNGPRFRTHDT